MGRKSKKKQMKDADGLTKSERKEIQALCSQLLDLCKTPTQVNAQKQWEEYKQIRGVVEMIRTKQQGLHQLFLDENREENLEKLLTWVKENKAVCKNIRIANYDTEGYGIQATAKIKEDDVFLSIPRKIMVTVETAKQSELGKLAETDPILKSMPNVLLAIHILNEKYKEDSFWKPYLDCLPHSYSVPLYFNERELNHLQGSQAYSESMKQYKNIARQYAYFNKLFHTSPDVADIPLRNTFTYDGYRWAVSTVMTRQNQIPSTDRKFQCTALIPVWDMCNHTNGKIRTGFDLAQNCSSSLALKNYQPNEQVRIYYGKRTNMELLVHNGFVFSGNEDDGVAIQLGMSKDDKLYQLKMELLAMYSLRPNDTYTVLPGDNPLSKQLLVFLRIFHMTEDELNIRFKYERKQEMLEFLLKDKLPVSKTNEIKLWTFLEARLSLLLRLYKSNVEEDEALLEQSDISEFSRQCIQLRLGEKRILQNAINHSKKSKEIAENWDESTLPDPLGHPKEDASRIADDKHDRHLIQLPEIVANGDPELQNLSLRGNIVAQSSDDTKREEASNVVEPPTAGTNLEASSVTTSDEVLENGH